MSFVRLTGPTGPIWIKPVWVQSVEDHDTTPDLARSDAWARLRLVGGTEVVVQHTPDEAIELLYPPTQPVRRTMRRVQEQ